MRNKRNSKSSKPVVTNSKPEANKPDEPKRHDIAKLTYTGASPTVRGHAHKLSAVRLDIGAAKITIRDETFVHDMHKRYADKAFPRLDCDAGNVRRAASHGFLIVSGDLADRRNCKLQLTSAGIERARIVAKKLAE